MTAMPQPYDDHATIPMEGLDEGATLLNGQFTITSQLSRGGFGITYLAKDNTLDRTVVIKECFPETFCVRQNATVRVKTSSNEAQYRSIVEMFMREARAIAKMRHPAIVGVHRVFEDNQTAYMALDMIDGHDLLEIIHDDDRNLTPHQVKDILIKVLDAVALIHSEDLLHRDISPDNILINKWGDPVLIDFGAAREEASKNTRIMSSVLVVKDGYSPQEFYFAGSAQTASSDLYALGATFYHLIAGEAPINSQARVAEVAIKNGDPYKPLVGRFPEYDEKFLESIDKAMMLASVDRHQAAEEWIEAIDPLQKTAESYNRPAVNASLGKTLTSLVTDTNRDLLTIPPDAGKMRPIDELTDKNVVFADWIKEFNDETVREHPKEGGYELETPEGLSKDPSKSNGGAKYVDPAFLIDDGTAEMAAEAKKARKTNFKLVFAVIVLLGGMFAVMSSPDSLTTAIAGVTGSAPTAADPS
ncbi:MAG: serine/threonine-protein kinase [Pseudomonadota bacterium]